MSDRRGLEAGAPVADGPGAEGGCCGSRLTAGDSPTAGVGGIQWGGINWDPSVVWDKSVIKTTTAAGSYSPPPLFPKKGSTADQKFENAVDTVFTELEQLLLSKHSDYGPHNIGKSPGGALNGLRVRLWDKLARINHLVDNQQSEDPRHESLEDSFKDLANYAVIALLVLRGEWPQ